MTVRSLAGKLIRLVSWLCFEHQWTQSELLIIAAIALLLLLLLLRLLQKGMVAAARADEVPERSPIIGVKLADHKRSHREIRDLERSHSAPALEKHGHGKKLKETTRRLESSQEQIRQLQHEITVRRQTEARLQQQAAELTAVNKQLQYEIGKRSEAEVHLEQQVAALTAANAQLQQQISGRKQPGNLPAKSSEQGLHPKRQSGPLNIEELSQLAELGKRLAPRRST